MRMRPAALAGEEEGAPTLTPTFAFKWTGNANMATVGEWKRSEFQATGSVGGRLRVGGGTIGREVVGAVSWDETVQNPV